MSACHLQKQFKRYVGQSPTDYLICQRMLHAKELMRTTRKPIGEIAAMVGVTNLGYFTRQFKKQEVCLLYTATNTALPVKKPTPAT